MSQELIKSDFNEREYEFAFNHEFATKNRNAIIATRFPNTREGHQLPYDIEFRMSNATTPFTHSIFLQHKIAKYAPRNPVNPRKPYTINEKMEIDPAQQKSGIPAIDVARDKDYYFFKLHQASKTKSNPRPVMYRQHNVLVKLRKLGEEIFYCVPLFNSNSKLDSFSKKFSIMDNCLWIDVEDLEYIRNRLTHHISYGPALGDDVLFHSKPTKVSRFGNPENMIKNKSNRTIDPQYIASLYENILTILNEEGLKQILMEEEFHKNHTVIAKVLFLVRRAFHASWLIQ